MVDIHRKPGYDPLELFMDMATRTTSQDEGMIHGSHGRIDSPGAGGGGGLVACDGIELPAAVEAADMAEIVGRLAQS
jgi:hypothetical protein